MLPTLADLADDLASGRTKARALVEACIARIDDPEGEGGRAFVRVNREAARASADAQDLLRKAGAAPSPFAGIPIGVKDLFDVAGEVTAAGSKVLRDSPPAKADAPAVARLRRAGFVVVGRNTMTEFAYSGLGMNPHTGNPAAPFERATTPRVSGGSSSGGAVAVADGMAHAALGTDTGGSCRIPAAFCGLVGFKPTARRVPREGAFPLSTTLDSIGPIARSVACCATLDAILSGGDAPLPARPVAGLRLLVPTTVALDGLDAPVAAAFEAALERLAKAGAHIVSAPFPEFGEIATLNAKGGFAAAESYAVHRRLLAEKGEGYDPRVSVRVRRGSEQSAADYVELVAARAGLVARAAARLAGFDALALPTVAIAPPRIADLLTDDDAYGRANLMALRNPTLINMIDGCAISLPLTGEGGLPAGLMLAGAPGTDAALFAVAAGVEAALKN
ncbi:aspartyl-tRNA(Asn)/glutamyl-tRNA(Gln) amidotransferase subunit A [Xanthobacter flavus]|uniref:Amidase n=1 Tax=Xanthobacter flavus TaxID=281 RepID=A0A9W6CLV7_XANFL|nr:amidase [Xanthobacter flavus]MDR6336034.1 aspartyl-tRNA(Asn)/glutamyl-tRNA(Gln) amidotransferase subunit A [Xanthobacter flavus]GLI24941.1 amidase [Xanthobacter flavus]